MHLCSGLPGLDWHTPGTSFSRAYHSKETSLRLLSRCLHSIAEHPALARGTLPLHVGT